MNEQKLKIAQKFIVLLHPLQRAKAWGVSLVATSEQGLCPICTNIRKIHYSSHFLNHSLVCRALRSPCTFAYPIQNYYEK